MTSGTDMVAIIAGQGVLPQHLADVCRTTSRGCVIVQFAGTDLPWSADFNVIKASFERLGDLFEALKSAKCRKVVMAGTIIRPNVDPRRFDAKSRAIAPLLFAVLGQGDDAVLRAVVAMFEREDLSVLAAHAIAPDLLAENGAMGAISPSQGDLADIARAHDIVTALGRLDLGQAAVVAQGLCLGLETLQGTDKMLEFVAQTAEPARLDANGAKGVVLKAPKPGQDLRVDMPAIGPQTVALAVRAGLAGIALAPGHTLILEREKTIAAANDAGLFIYGGPITAAPADGA